MLFFDERYQIYSSCSRIKDGTTTSKVQADPFSRTSHLKYLLALQAGVSLPCWDTVFAVAEAQLLTPSILKRCFRVAAPHKPGRSQSSFHIPSVRCCTAIPTCSSLRGGQCVQKTSTNSPVVAAVPAPERRCRRSGAGLHGNAAARPALCASALAGDASSRPSSKAC